MLCTFKNEFCPHTETSRGPRGTECWGFHRSSKSCIIRKIHLMLSWFHHILQWFLRVLGEGVWLHLTLGPVAHHHAPADQENHSGGRGRPEMIRAAGSLPNAWHLSPPPVSVLCNGQVQVSQYSMSICIAANISREYISLHWYSVIII